VSRRYSLVYGLDMWGQWAAEFTVPPVIPAPGESTDPWAGVASAASEEAVALARAAKIDKAIVARNRFLSKARSVLRIHSPFRPSAVMRATFQLFRLNRHPSRFRKGVQIASSWRGESGVPRGVSWNRRHGGEKISLNIAMAW